VVGGLAGELGVDVYGVEAAEVGEGVVGGEDVVERS